ncbi:terminase family protein [Gammaproteobacteria bacterium]|nr:terminase family protein [Gammaproteobacteria bacterium]
MNDTYNGNSNVKRDGATTQYTQYEVDEYIKCRDNPAYFARKYCKVIHLDKGLVDFDLYPYQEKMFSHFANNRFSIVLACRQSGKSISSVAYLLHYAVFNATKTVAILANKGATSQEMLSRVTLMLENLPFFLQPGTKALNKRSIEFSNNSKIVAAATSGSSIRGMSVNLLYLDEFAFVEDAATFYTSTYPVVSSGKDTKVIITSTANGIGNMYHKLWEGAVQKTNEYIPFRVDWWDVPGRDDQWQAQTISNTSKLQFDQEFGNTFFGTGDTLIDGGTLMELRAINPIRHLEGGALLVYKEVEKGHNYICVVDVAKGVGGDYSTFNIIDTSVTPFEQVCVYRNNKISPILFPNIIAKYALTYNKAYVIVENNDQGTIVCNGLYYELEYEDLHVESAMKSNGLGVTMNKKVKRLGCSTIKDIIEGRKLKLNDQETIIEISTFVAKGQSYEASDGNHDDLMMNLVLFGYFTLGTQFSDLSDVNMKDLLFNQRMAEIENDMVPFGFVDDGLDEIYKEPEPDPWSLEKKPWVEEFY